MCSSISVTCDAHSVSFDLEGILLSGTKAQASHVSPVCVGAQVCGYKCARLRVFSVPTLKGTGGGDGGRMLVGGVGGRHCPNDAFSTPLIQWLCSPVNPSHATH